MVPVDKHWCLYNRFYRVKMHSADYAVARCLSVCLSVRPSVDGLGWVEYDTCIIFLDDYTTYGTIAKDRAS